MAKRFLNPYEISAIAHILRGGPPAPPWNPKCFHAYFSTRAYWADSRGARGTHDDNLSYLVKNAECPRGREFPLGIRGITEISWGFEKHFAILAVRFPRFPRPIFWPIFLVLSLFSLLRSSYLPFCLLFFGFRLPAVMVFFSFSALYVVAFPGPKVPFLLFPSEASLAEARFSMRETGRRSGGFGQWGRAGSRQEGLRQEGRRQPGAPLSIRTSLGLVDSGTAWDTSFALR